MSSFSNRFLTRNMTTMLDYLDQLRAKPIHVRKRIAFGTTFALSFLIAAIWWNSFNASPTLAEENMAASASSPWDVVFDTIGHAKESTVATYDDTIEQLRSLGEEATADVDTGNANENIEPSVVEGDIVYPADLHGAVDGNELYTRPKSADEMPAQTTND